MGEFTTSKKFTCPICEKEYENIKDIQQCINKHVAEQEQKDNEIKLAKIQALLKENECLCERIEKNNKLLEKEGYVISFGYHIIGMAKETMIKNGAETVCNPKCNVKTTAKTPVINSNTKGNKIPIYKIPSNEIDTEKFLTDFEKYLRELFS